MTEMKDRLQKARLARGFAKATPAAKAFGWTVPTYLGYENGDRKPSREAVGRIAEAYGVSLDWLLTGRGDMANIKRTQRPRVPIMGNVSAGGAIGTGSEQVPEEGFYDVESLIPLPADVVGFIVVGESMYPRYDAGDVIVCRREGTPLSEIPDGAEAAVKAVDGSRYLKRLARTSEPGVFDLLSHNAAPIRSVKIEWASKVAVTVRSDEWVQLSAADRAKAAGYRSK
jgi:hypothetical protein